MKELKSDDAVMLTFDDGSKLKVIMAHRLYDYENETFASTNNIKVGFKTINSKGKVLTLTDIKHYKEDSVVCNVITQKHINLFVNGILTSRGSNNLYEIKNMKFVKEGRETISRSDLEEVSDEYYENLRLSERSINMYGSKEETINHINHLVKELIKTKK